jgi:hypothetical protein
MEKTTSQAKKTKSPAKAKDNAKDNAKATPKPSPLDPNLTLDALTRMDGDGLGALYAKGVLPDSLSALDGSPPGRMLAIVGGAGRGALGAGVRNLAAAKFFPWAGKTFQSTDDATGGGINRVRGLGDKYPFKTRIEPSAVDGEPCILLDYSSRENPFFIRAVRDELREVGPGLFLGPAMLDKKSGAATVLWFAIDKSSS